jgi:beta-barrel assembly-enhancing protease
VFVQRRQVLKGGFVCLCCVYGAGALADTSTGYNPPARFSRPALDSEEGGLWAIMDREEQRTRRSPFALKDQALATYLGTVVQKLAGEHKQDIRLHVVRAPFFNALMAPNGMMQLWTGLLLRIENEAQLAAVIGHELGHFFERHGVEKLKQAKSASAMASVLAFLGPIGAIASLAVIAGAAGFGRDQERDADKIGLNLMSRAGYSPEQAASVWKNVVAEQEAGKRSISSGVGLMFASHPAPAERVDNLVAVAKELPGENLGMKAWFTAIEPHRFAWIEDEIRRAHYEESLNLFDRLLQLNFPQPEIHYAKGEVLRLRGKEQDHEKAMQSLLKALEVGNEPAQTHRSLGLLLRAAGDKPGSTQSFKRYLEKTSSPPDAALIQGYLHE